MCSGKGIAANSWCVGEPNDFSRHNERDIVIGSAPEFCFLDVAETFPAHYICKQGQIELYADKRMIPRLCF